MTELVTAWMLGCVTGFFMGVTLAGRRRPTCREMMRDPGRQPTFAELLMPKHGECDWPYKLKETIRADIECARAALDRLKELEQSND